MLYIVICAAVILCALSAPLYALPQSGRVLSRGLPRMPSAGRPAPSPAAGWVVMPCAPCTGSAARRRAGSAADLPPTLSGHPAPIHICSQFVHICLRFSLLKLFFRIFSRPLSGGFFSEKNRRPARTYVKAEKIVAPRAGGCLIFCCYKINLYNLPDLLDSSFNSLTPIL